MTSFRDSFAVALAILFFSAGCASTQEADVPGTAARGGGELATLPQEVPAQEMRPQGTRPGAITHAADGKEECLVCHAPGATPITDVTPTHEGRGNETCMWCHATDSPMLTMTPTATPHPRATAETDCMRCHAPEASERATDVPATHEGRGIATCLWCHKKVEGF